MYDSEGSPVWLITGCSRGIGRALAEAVPAGGRRLLATARRPETLSGLVERYGGLVRPFALDVTDAEGAGRAVRAAVDTFGRLDVVVNNAGYANSAAIEETPEADFRAQIEANLFGVVNVTKAAIPVFRARRAGHFVQFSSIGGRVGGTPGMGAYQTAKFGVEGFSEVLAAEMRPLGVKVTIVEPGNFRTDWSGSSMRVPEPGPDYDGTVGEMNRFRQANLGRQPGDPARAAEVVMDLVELDEPPLRMVLGDDAVRLAETSGRARLEELARWADLSRSTAFA
ncbi:oxidoreductase [Streptomyces sp. SBT349]|uniref:oxidoreductase n=1 Tax=Streptomyces sp. SBT349 TaxID=1580539 RepID=UPI00066AAAE0|nr:oxidoreductase [Streptomyces sp. SBT349]